MRDVPRPQTLSYEQRGFAKWRLQLVGKVALSLLTFAALLVVVQIGYRWLEQYRLYSKQNALISAPRPADQIAVLIPATPPSASDSAQPASKPSPAEHSTIFARVLRASDGTERLVALSIDTNPIGDHGGWTVIITAELQQPAGVRSSESPQVRRVDALRALVRPHERLEIFYAKPNDVDLPQLSIRYELDDQPGTIDGWLLPGGVFKLEVRDGPLRDR